MVGGNLSGGFYPGTIISVLRCINFYAGDAFMLPRGFSGMVPSTLNACIFYDNPNGTFL